MDSKDTGCRTLAKSGQTGFTRTHLRLTTRLRPWEIPATNRAPHQRLTGT